MVRTGMANTSYHLKGQFDRSLVFSDNGPTRASGYADLAAMPTTAPTYARAEPTNEPASV